MNKWFSICSSLLIVSSIIAVSCTATVPVRETPREETYTPHVVVALIDSGINPYHEIYRRPHMTMHPSQIIEGFPEETIALNLTFTSKSYQTNVHNDLQVWYYLKDKTLYWIPGTNILAISFGGYYKNPYYVLDVGEGHGTGTSSVLVEENPDAYILMIQAKMETFIEAASWAMEQPWIDIISISYGNKSSLTFSSPHYEHYPEISKECVAKGKIIVHSAGNSKRPPWFSNIAGPPWLITAGGAEPLAHGINVHAAWGTDFVAEYTRIFAQEESLDEYSALGGTSLSAPAVAGIISKIVLNLRQKYNYTHGIINNSLLFIPEKGIDISNLDIRNALNHTATYWQLNDWRPLRSHYLTYNYTFFDENISSFNEIMIRMILFLFAGVTVPVNPIAPWLQMGWGYVDASLINETIAILSGDQKPPEKQQGAVDYMNFIYQLRYEIWGEKTQ